MASCDSVLTLREHFFAFEKKYNLFALQCCNVYFWDYIRATVYNGILWQKGVVQNRAFMKQKRSWRCLQEMMHLLPAFFRKAPSPASYDLLFFDEPTRKDNVTIPFLKAITSFLKILVVDFSRISNAVGQQYPCDFINGRLWSLWAHGRAITYRFKEAEKRMLERFQRLIQEEFTVALNFTSLVRSSFLVQYFAHCYIEELIQKYRPKMVGFINDARRKGIVAVCHKYGIPVFELQHGATSPLDMLWNYSFLSDPQTLALPDIVFTFGEYWHPHHNFPCRKVAVGFPHLENERERMINRSVAKEPNSLLVISTMEPKLAEIIIDLAKRMPRCSIYYKLRADESAIWQDLYPNELGQLPNIHVISHREGILYEYFQRAAYQIGSNSTALYEGLAFGLHTLVFKGFYHESMLDLVEDGCSFLVEDAEDLYRILSQGLVPRSRVDIDLFFRRNSAENIRREMARCLA